MSANSETSNSTSTNLGPTNLGSTLVWTILLILLGVAALCGGTKWLALLIPAAMLVWYGAGPTLRSGRN
jgi:hypothetical protein